MTQLNTLDQNIETIAALSLFTVVGLTLILACLCCSLYLFKLILWILQHVGSELGNILKAVRKIRQSAQTDIKAGQNYLPPNDKTKHVTIGQLHSIRQRLKSAFFNEEFLIVSEPIIVVSSGIKIIDKLGGVSAWILSQSYRQEPANPQEVSDEDTDTESQPEIINDQKLKKTIMQAMKSNKRGMTVEQQALELYNRVSACYSSYWVTVGVAEGKWCGVWNSAADYSWKQGPLEFLLILS